MWLGLACGSAFFAGITAILAKIGIKNTDSTLATAIRTVVAVSYTHLDVYKRQAFRRKKDLARIFLARSFCYSLCLGFCKWALPKIKLLISRASL